jgi:hypothetical protein
LRERLVRRVSSRDRLTPEQARALVNALPPHEMTRLEMEARDHERPAFTSDYDPFERP